MLVYICGKSPSLGSFLLFFDFLSEAGGGGGGGGGGRLAYFEGPESPKG